MSIFNSDRPVVHHHETEIFNTGHVAGLHQRLQDVNISIEKLKKTSMFDKAEAAQVVIDLQRDLLAHVVFTIHLLHNEIERLKK